MRELQLTRGKVALIDDSDFEGVAAFRWNAYPGGHTWYAKSSIRIDGVYRTVPLHRRILNAAPGFLVDHIDGDGLNNRRSNIRVCTHSQNQGNQRPVRNPTGFRGVVLDTGRWRARIKIFGVDTWLGGYATAEEAARAFDVAALAHWGEFAQLNFPNQRAA